MKVIFIIAGIAAILSIWLIMDYKLGRKKHLAGLKEKEYPLRKSNIQLFSNGNPLFSDMFAEIRSAKQHIHILFYIVKNDQFSKDFFSLLKQKAKEGVEVKLLLDWVGSNKVKRSMVKDLIANGAHFSFCQVPRPPFLFYSFQERNHRKITVIDGKIGYLGGFNIGKEYIDQDPKLSPWRDYHLKILGEGVRDLQEEFLLDWQQATDSKEMHHEKYYPPLFQGDSEHQLKPTEGVFLEEIYSEILGRAKRAVVIGTPYFIPSDRIFELLRSLLRKKIQITVIVPFHSDHPLVKEASFKYFRILIQEGAKIYQYQKGFYHAKFILIDDEILDIGTANFDKRSFFLNHEMNCYIYDKKCIKQMRKELEQDLENCLPLTLQDLNKPNPWRDLKERVAALVSTFL